MIKMYFIKKLVHLVLGAIVLGIGVWYVSSSLRGTSLSYISLNNFMTSIGAPDGNVASVNGCFLCTYIQDLFVVLGNAAESFWAAVLDNLWILMSIGFGIFLFVHTIKYMFNAMKETAKFDAKSEAKFEIGPWFDTVWRQGLRIMIAGAFLGVFGMGGMSSIKTLSNITIQPVMYLGTELSMVATGISDASECNFISNTDENAMASVSNSMMCMIGNVNSVILAGAAGGFSLMNYAWMGLGGGAFTWIAGLAVVILFVIVGFNLFFQILSVVFKIIFLVVFLPFLVAAWAFEKTWGITSKAVGNGVNMLVNCAIKILAISLKIVILFNVLFYAADEFFPGPRDNFTVILPPLMGVEVENPDTKTMAIMNTFSKCENVSLVDGVVDKDSFKTCFNNEKASVEARHPGAFDFMHDGWGFLVLMLSLGFLYFYVLSPKIDKLLVSVPSVIPNDKESAGEGLDGFGGEVKKYTKMTWQKPQQWIDKLIPEK